MDRYRDYVSLLALVEIQKVLKLWFEHIWRLSSRLKDIIGWVKVYVHDRSSSLGLADGRMLGRFRRVK